MPAKIKKKLSKCSKCGNNLEPIYETVDLEGRHREIVGYKQCECEGGE